MDEEDRDFYEELRELRGEVPSSILGIPIEKEVEVEPEEPVAEEAVTEIETDPLVDEAELE